jgi:hypothetical protein
MKKSFSILFAVLAVLIVSAYFLYPKQSYGGLGVSDKQYKKILQSKSNINSVLNALNNFNPKNEKSYKNVKKSINHLIVQNGKNLTSSEFNILKKSAGSPDGLLGTIEDAYTKKYILDDEVSSSFHEKFKNIVEQSAAGITESHSQARLIANQIEKDLNIDSRIYKIGSDE